MANTVKDFVSPNGPILLLSAKGLTTAGIAEANGVKDFSGNGNHGTSSGTSVINDSIGPCFSEGTITIDLQQNYNGDNFSMAFWTRTPSATQHSSYGVRLYQDSTTKIYIWYNGSNKNLNVAVNGSGESQLNTSVADVQDGNWHHVVVTYNGSLISKYEDGILTATHSKVSSGDTFNKFTLTSSYRYHEDIHIYPRVLSATEVKYLYNGFQPNIIAGQAIPSGAILDLSARGLTTSGIAQANGVVDRSGNGNHGQASVGVSVYRDSEKGDVFKFAGNCINGQHNINVSPDFSICFWYKFSTLSGGQECILSLGDNSNVFIVTETKKIYLFNASTSVSSNLDVALSADVWNHIVITSDNTSNQIAMYLNTVLKTTNTDKLTAENVAYAIGKRISNNANFLTNSYIADLRIYPRALTASEVQQLADASLKKIQDVNIGSDLIKHIYYGSNLIYAKTDDYEVIPSEVIFELHQINETTQTYPIVYSGKNANFSGITYSNSTPDLGAWKDWIDAHFTPVMLRSNGTVAYELNKDNQNYKKDGTTASDVANINYDGNAMLRIKKFYLSCSTAVVGSGSSAYSVHTVKISDTKKDSSYTCWGFVDANGNEKDYVYYALYNCHKDSNNKLRSMSGVTLNDSRPGNQLLSYNDMVAAAKANGTGWDISNLALENAIGLVLMMIYKSVNPTFINQEYVDLYKQAMSVYQVTGTRNADGGFPYVTATQKQKALWIESFWRSNYDNINQSRAWINGLSSLRTGTGINDFLPYYRKQPPYDDFTTISNWTPMSSTTPHAYMSDAVSHELRTVMFYDNIMFPKDDGVARRGSITAATINRYFGGGEISGSTSTSLQYTDRLLPAQTCGGVMQDQYSSMPHYLGYSLVGTGTNNYQKYGSARLIFFGDPVFSRTQLSTSALGSNSRCVFVSPEGNMFATDWSGKCVKIFNSSGVYVRSFTPLSGKIPYGITGDATYLYVCYWDSANIYKYQYSGTDTPTLVSTWTAPVIYNDGAALYGDYLYVVSQQKQMFKINTSTGAVTSIETSAYAINAIGIDTKNNRIVTVHNGGLGQAEAPNNKAIIKIHDISGNLLTQKILDGEYTSAINGAQGVVVDKNGYIYLGGAYSIRAQYNQGLLVLNENLEVAYDISYTTCPTFCYSFCYDSYHNRIVWIGSGIGASPYIYAIDI